MSEMAFDSLPDNLREALKRCDVLVGLEQLEYFYNLYDPETGGFYYSISSRDSEEMTPFAEGTNFVHGALWNGGIRNFPDWYKKKVSEWILPHQDESDGFFYEKLWGKITSGPRLNRDLSSSGGILHTCGVEPLYTLPQDRLKNDGIEANATIPDYLTSEETMKKYLDSLDWSQKSIWSTGQWLSTAGSFIRTAGLFEFTRDYVTKKQNPETGLFGEGLGWMNTNGAMKLSHFFSTPDSPYPNPELAIESVVKLYGGDEPPTAATWIWNPFVLVDRIVSNAGDRAESLRALLLERGAEMVNRAVDCALLLHRPDGGFSGHLSRGGFRQQGYLYGHGLKEESDLDGTLIAGQRLRTSIHNVFGLKASCDYYTKYEEEFWERLKNKPPVVKTLPRPEGPLNPPSSPTPIYKPVW